MKHLTAAQLAELTAERVTDRAPTPRPALVRVLAAGLLLVGGVAAAVAQYPGGFDWAYTVISRLASPRHNPAGAPWLTGALLASVVLVWPVTATLARPATPGGRVPRVAVAALRVGLGGAGLLALEGLLALDFSRFYRKGHELLALVTFLGCYTGVIGVYVRRAREARRFPWSALLVVLPLLAVGVTQLALYLGQRDLGWVNTGWRELGVPLWLSFAFWQWLAVALLGAGFAHLVVGRGLAVAE